MVSMKNSSFSNRDNSSVLWSKFMFKSITMKSKHSWIHWCNSILVSLQKSIIYSWIYQCHFKVIAKIVRFQPAITWVDALMHLQIYCDVAGQWTIWFVKTTKKIRFDRWCSTSTGRRGRTDNFKDPLCLFRNDEAFEIEAVRRDCET